MTKSFLQIICLLFVFNLFYSCQKKELTANAILLRSSEAHGGFDTWKTIDTISYHKKTTLYTKDGFKQKETNQYQSFYFGNSINGQISIVGIDTTVYQQQNGKYHKLIGDSLVSLTDIEKQSIKNSFKSAFYVVSQPFNLIESSALLSYEKDTIIEGNKTHIVNVSYKNDTKDSDSWTYFFDALTFRIVSCKVYHSLTTSYIKNTKYDFKTDFVFNAERESFLLKKDGTKDYLRAAYFYSDFSISFHDD